MASMATVTTRPCARSAATTPPAMSICERIQPPKMSPLALASAGRGTVRITAERGRAMSDSLAAIP